MNTWGKKRGCMYDIYEKEKESGWWGKEHGTQKTGMLDIRST